MRWHTCSKRVLKRWTDGFFQDGICYGHDRWNSIMTILGNLRKGDPIYVPHISAWGELSNINLWWRPVQIHKFKTFHNGFCDDYISRGPKHHKFVYEFCMDVPFDNNWVAFNKAAGLHPAIKMITGNDAIQNLNRPGKSPIIHFGKPSF
jgi:hypothetical protein